MIDFIVHNHSVWSLRVYEVLRNAMLCAMFSSDVGMLRVLAEHKADVNMQLKGLGGLAMLLLCFFGVVMCFLCFLLCVLDLILVEFHFDSSDHFHVTCCLQGALGYYDSQTLLMAAAKSRQDTFSWLWIHGSDAFCEFQLTCLPVCLFGMFSVSPVQGPEVFKTLIELRADVNARSNNGMNCASFGNWMWGVWSCNVANMLSKVRLYDFLKLNSLNRNANFFKKTSEVPRTKSRAGACFDRCQSRFAFALWAFRCWPWCEARLTIRKLQFWKLQCKHFLAFSGLSIVFEFLMSSRALLPCFLWICVLIVLRINTFVGCFSHGFACDSKGNAGSPMRSQSRT